jgi:hypothetical protein
MRYSSSQAFRADVSRRGWPAAVLLLLAVGCGAGTALHGSFEAAQWTPELTGSATKGSTLELVNDAGLVNDDAFWAFDTSLRVQLPGESRVGAYTFNFGTWQHTYGGKVPGPVDFAGVSVNGPVRTTADLKLYKFSYGEPGGTSSGHGRTDGLLGLHYMDFEVRADGSNGSASQAGTAPMFVIGWRIAYESQGLVYFFGFEWMDLDTISLDNVKGEVTDWTTGIRWFPGKHVALSLAWRTYDADLVARSERLDIDIAGAYFSLFVIW